MLLEMSTIRRSALADEEIGTWGAQGRQDE